MNEAFVGQTNSEATMKLPDRVRFVAIDGVIGAGKTSLARILAKELGATPDDIDAAITESIRVSVESYEGRVKLLEMKGE